MAKASDPNIEFSVKVVEGGKVKFESSITHPLMMSPERQKEAVEAWMELMASGLKLGRLAADDEAEKTAD